MGREVRLLQNFERKKIKLQKEIDYLDKPLREYCDKLASKLPYPGGGSAVALVSALANSLVSMVCNFTIGKKSYARYAEEIKEILTQNEFLRKELQDFIEADSRIYKKISELYKTKDNKTALEETLKESASLHLEIAGSAIKVLQWNNSLLSKGNKNLLSDVGISAILAVAAFQGAKINALINLKFIEDTDFCIRSLAALDQLEYKVKALGEKVYCCVEKSLRKKP